VIEGVDEREIAQMTSVLKRMRANLGRSPYEAFETVPIGRKARAS